MVRGSYTVGGVGFGGGVGVFEGVVDPTPMSIYTLCKEGVCQPL